MEQAQTALAEGFDGKKYAVLHVLPRSVFVESHCVNPNEGKELQE